MKVDRDKLPHVRWLRKQEERRRFAELLEVQSNRPWVATPRPESASSWGLSEHQQRYWDRRARGEEERPSLFERFAAKPFETLEPPKTDGVMPTSESASPSPASVRSTPELRAALLTDRRRA